jgi:hypothetical protein
MEGGASRGKYAVRPGLAALLAFQGDNEADLVRVIDNIEQKPWQPVQDIHRPEAESVRSRWR